MKYLAILLITLTGCLSVETRKTIDERRAAVEDAKVRLAQITNVDAPDYAEAKAAVQTAEAQLEVAKAQANQERVQKGLEAVTLGTSIISPFLPGGPFAGAALAAIAAAVSALKK